MTEKPTEPHCHVRLRPNNVDKRVESGLDVVPHSDVDEIADAAVRGLEVLLSKIDTITTAADAVDFLSRRRLTAYECVFGWYLHHGQLDRARTFVTELHAYFGAERRWEIFASRLDEVAERVSPTTPWRSWITTAESAAEVRT